MSSPRLVDLSNLADAAMSVCGHDHGVVRLEDWLGVDRGVRRGAQVDGPCELSVVLGYDQPLSRPVTELLDGRGQVVKLLVTAASQERLPQLGELGNV